MDTTLATKTCSIPWCWPAWQQRTGLISAPFSITITEDTPDVWRLPEDNQAVWTFVSNFWAVEDIAQVDYIKKEQHSNDNTKGRELWLDYFHCKWSEWKVNGTIDAVLVERGLDPYAVMRRAKSANLPDLGASQVALAYPSLAEALFGTDAFTEDEFLTFAEEKKNLDAESIRTWLRDVEGLTKILVRYGDQESLQQLSEKRDTLRDLLQGLGVDVKDGNKLRLPKSLRQALSFLATEHDITLLAASIQDQLKLCDPNATSEDSIPEFDPESTDACDFQWSEGVEEFNGMSEDQLWTILGLPEKRIPFFNLVQDPYGNCDPWTEEGQKWLKDPANGEPLALHWHQLVGVAKMMKNAFLGIPILLMDDVGLGKTIQVTALIALLAFYREFYIVHNRFPGKIGKFLKRNSCNIPNFPVILVIPANLVGQFTSELHRFLQKGSFDVLPYLATWQSRQSWWQDIWCRSIQPEGRRIIITTPKALASDFDRIFEANNLSPTKSPRQKANYARDVSKTAYSQYFLIGSVDEAHNQRNIRKGYWAIFSLRERSQTMVAMTATPITSGPLRLKQGDRITKVIIGMIKGNTDNEVPSLYRTAMLTWVNEIRKRFSGVVIRRTIWSVDNHGSRISGLGPFMEHNLLVTLYNHEVDNLELIAKDLVEEGGAKAAKFAAGSWRKDPSRKLDVLVQVIQWHQVHDNRQPLCIVDDQLVVSTSNSAFVPGPSNSVLCDKILVYCAFPSSYIQVTKVLELHSIQSLQIHGKLPPSARMDIIAKFKASGRDGPRVLIISNDSLWSATDEGQLIGRIYRPPQSKTVHIYRIIAANTQDVFLNNISFSKAAILDAFTGAPPSLRRYPRAKLAFRN
ncbi:hypothetical protein P692DRAFT_201716179 [Suillus brevipes Sb2]|nr:hypothetical protein P692DRAFT_201716179 [Suillus brevipes Sb2]